MRKQNCVIWIQTVWLYTQKIDDIYKDIAEDVETRPLPKGKNKKVIRLMKDELTRKIIENIVGLRAKR